MRPLYAEVLRYVNDVTSQPGADAYSLWSSDVYGKSGALADIFSGNISANSRAIEDRILNFDMTPDNLRCIVADMERADVGGIALRAAEQYTALLSAPPTTVYILPLWAGSPFPQLNIANGFSHPNTVVAGLWETSQPSSRIDAATIGAAWVRYIPDMVAHECFEVTRYARIGFDSAYATLLAHMITDGMADSFALAQACTGQPWDDNLTPQQERDIWSRIQAQLLSKSSQDDIMYGNASEGYPPDTGYTIGFHIVQGYLDRHPGASYSALAGMSTATLFAGSGYSG